MEQFGHDGPSSSPEATVGAFEFNAALAQLGLDRYEGTLRENGFWGWDNVAGITESDMAEMSFRLGDRRKLQRLLREHTSSSARKSGMTSRSPQEPASKRRYRRHPRPDPNAPIRPKTAYVVFGEHVRQDPALSGLSFTDIAKETGRRWKEISEEEKEHVWDAPAAKKMEEYRDALEGYMLTEDYQRYQKYLQEFRQGQSDNERVDLSDRRSLSSNFDHASSNPLLRERAPPARASVAQLLDQFETPSQGSDEDIQAMDVDDERDETVNMLFQEASGAVKAGLEEVHHISASLGINPHRTRVAAFPDEATTTKSVETFLRCTGALVYLWNHEQALHQVRSLYQSPDDSNPANAIEVFAMATVGSYCDGHPEVKGFADKFLEYFVYMLSSSLHIGDLPRMRLFACLAICRFTNSVESARKLMLSALNIGREAFKSESFKVETSEEELRHWWNVLRSIIFLESWFAYNTHIEPRITHEDLDLYRLPESQSHNTSEETYQGRIFELGRLATYVALDLKNAVGQPEATHARKYLDSLNQWHRTLPPPMQLSHISLSNPLTLDWHTKRSVLQLHILFLGLFIEPYRRCLIDLGKFRLGDKPKGKLDLEALISVEEQCVSAARQSARVASLVQFDNLVRAQCWILLYTSYVGCTVLLYGTTQRILQGAREDVGLELAYASSHIAILSICSYENEVARKMYTSLQILFNDVRDVLTVPVHATGMHGGSSMGAPAPMMLTQGQVVQTPDDVRRTVVDVARQIVDILENSINF